MLSLRLLYNDTKMVDDSSGDFKNTMHNISCIHEYKPLPTELWLTDVLQRNHHTSSHILENQVT